jgi:hypothetical protein
VACQLLHLNERGSVATHAVPLKEIFHLSVAFGCASFRIALKQKVLGALMCAAERPRKRYCWLERDTKHIPFPVCTLCKGVSCCKCTKTDVMAWLVEKHAST